MALKDQAAKDFLDTLVSYELVTEDERNRILLAEEARGEVYSAEDIADLFVESGAMYRLKPSEENSFRMSAEAAGLDTGKYSGAATEPEGRSWLNQPINQESTNASDPTRADVLLGANPFTASTYWAIKAFNRLQGSSEDSTSKAKDDDEYTRSREVFNREMRSNLVTTLRAMGIDEVDVKDFMVHSGETTEADWTTGGMDIVDTSSQDYGAIRELLTKYDLSESEINYIFNQSVQAGAVASQKYTQRKEEIKAAEESVETILESDEKLANLKAWEILEEDKPGKYMFNEETGKIYETVLGLEVDQYGEEVIYGVDDDVPEPWEEAKGKAPWLGLGLGEDPNTPMEDAEDYYYQLRGVVENPDRYAADATRYLPGAGDFLGGFGSDYSVTLEGDQYWDRRGDDYRAGAIAEPSRTMYGASTEFRDNPVTETSFTARPFYEEDDNWALFAGMSKEAIGEMQQKLVSVGALEGGDIVEGSWGPAEAEVMKDWLFVANGKAERWEDVDIGLIQNMYSAKRSASTPTRQPFVARSYQAMDPATMEQSVQGVMRQMLGRDATGNEIADLGGYLSDQHRGSFVADVEAARNEYNATTRAIDTGQEQAGAEVQDVDFEARFIQQFEKTHEAEISRGERTETASGRQATIGNSLSNLMSKLGGGF